MQIILQEDEIRKALKHFLSNMGVSLAGKVVTIAFKAGRGENGNEAILTIEDDESLEPVDNSADKRVYKATTVEDVEDTIKGIEGGSSGVDPTVTDDTLVFVAS